MCSTVMVVSQAHNRGMRSGMGYSSCTVPYNRSPLRHVMLLSYVVTLVDALKTV